MAVMQKYANMLHILFLMNDLTRLDAVTGACGPLVMALVQCAKTILNGKVQLTRALDGRLCRNVGLLRDSLTEIQNWIKKTIPNTEWYFCWISGKTFDGTCEKLLRI